MPSKIMATLKEWKEIIVLLAAVGGLYVVAPREPSKPAPSPSTETAIALYRLTSAVDSLNRRVTNLTGQINALVRLQCVQSDRRALNLSGVACAGPSNVGQFTNHTEGAIMGTAAADSQKPDDENADLFVSSFLKLMRAHGEAYPGACEDADKIEAAWNAEKAAASSQTAPPDLAPDTPSA